MNVFDVWVESWWMNPLDESFLLFIEQNWKDIISMCSAMRCGYIY
jgi:hypothetical protein